MFTMGNIKQQKNLTKKAVFDIEAINWIEAYAVGFYDGENMLIFKGKNCIEQFLDFVLTKKYNNVIIYGHNAGKYDFLFLLKEFTKNKKYKDYIIKLVMVNSRVAEIKILSKSLKLKWIFRDCFTLLNYSLSKLCTYFNTEHKKLELDYNKVNWENFENLVNEWKQYLINDCLSLYEILTKFEQFILEKFNVNLKNSLTIAQLSLNIFRANYLKRNLYNYINHENEIRKSYYGGRVEIFKLYERNLKYYDFNSLYPFVMCEYDMPVGLPIKTYSFDVDDFGIAYAEIKCDYMYIPLLPCRNNNKLIFPYGKWSGWYCSEELKKAHDLGYDIKIYYGYKFEKENLFKDFIQDCYDLKCKAERNSFYYIISKLIMNSLYGKFAQKREKREIIINPAEISGLEPIDVNNEFEIYSKRVFSRATHIMPAISSFITAYARLELYKYLDEKTIYCDTDSIITTKELEENKKLGGLKLELKAEEGIFLLPKFYSLKTSNTEYVKCKGFDNVFNFELFRYGLENKDFSKFKLEKKTIGCALESFKRFKDFCILIDKTKRIISKYDKRIIIGYNTEPLKISL